MISWGVKTGYENITLLNLLKSTQKSAIVFLRWMIWGVPRSKGVNKMSKSALSVFVFGLYLLVLGIVLLVAPNFLLGLFSLPSTTEVWIRVAGMLVLFLCFYYTQAARKEMTDFFRWTVYVRSSVILFFAVFVLVGFAKPPLILFGVVDLLGAIWTGIALRSQKLPPKTS
jgi:hypothetical protein